MCIRDSPQDVPQDDLDAKIIELISQDNKISRKKMAEVLNVSTKTIQRHIKDMENVKYVGSGYSGHWEITE